MKCFKILITLMLATSSGGIALPQKPNILLLCVDDLRPELNCFDVPYVHSPNIDRLAAEGRAFLRHYVNAPSCGPSRYTMLTGRFGPVGNRALFERAQKMRTHPEAVFPSMPEWFRSHGYVTVSVGKVSHHPGGWGGEGWNDNTVVEMPQAWSRPLMPTGAWQTPRGAMHGAAHGFHLSDPGGRRVFESAKGDDSIYPDGLITDEALTQLGELTEDDAPFFLAVGLIKPYLPFAAPEKYYELYEGVELPPIPYPTKPAERTTWFNSGEFMKYNRRGKDPRTNAEFAAEVRRHYLACVSYADTQVGRILKKLKETGADKNTLIVLWGDHGWHLGEHAVWGKHTLFEESLRSPLVIQYPSIAAPGEKTEAMVQTVDIFPTLCALSGIPIPDFTQGISLQPILDDPRGNGHPAVAYLGEATTLRTATHRLVLHQDGYVELYDHTSPEKETRNVADAHPGIVRKMKASLEKQLNRYGSGSTDFI